MLCKVDLEVAEKVTRQTIGIKYFKISIAIKFNNVAQI